MRRVGQRQLAAATMALGVLLAVVGLVGLIRDGDDTVATIAPTAAPTSAAATTAPSPTTTTLPPSPTTTTTLATTTLPPETVEEFALAFADAIGRGDADFVFDRLHPVVLGLYDEASCRATVADRVLLISDYRLTGPVSGPEPTEFNVSNRVISTELYRAPVAFEFQGSTVETEGVFALVDGEMRWFTDCS